MSRYNNTPIKDFYLDIWETFGIDPSPNDIEYTIEPKYHEKPWLLSYDVYGTTDLWWVFAKRNQDVIIDPIEDFTSGTIIIVPPRNSIKQ